MNDGSEPRIRPIRPEDAEEWVRMRCALWPDGAEDHAGEIEAFFAGRVEEPEAVFVAESGGRWIAFMELSVRTNLAGHTGERVGYVEGLYVAPEFRGGNVARRLLQRAREWARAKRCEAFASDRAGRVIVYRKWRVASGE